MSTVFRPLGSNRGSKATHLGLWVLQAVTAAVVLAAGAAKLIGHPMMVQLFADLGSGQWPRYIIGSIEVLAAGLLVLPHPLLVLLGSFLIGCTMVGAIIAKIVVLHGSPALAVILLVFSAIIAWGRRPRIHKSYR